MADEPNNPIKSTVEPSQKFGATPFEIPVLPLQNTTLQPALQSLTDRTTRQALFDKSWTRAEQGDANDTRATILQYHDALSSPGGPDVRARSDR